MLEVQQASTDYAGQSRLEQIRASMNGPGQVTQGQPAAGQTQPAQPTPAQAPTQYAPPQQS